MQAVDFRKLFLSLGLFLAHDLRIVISFTDGEADPLEFGIDIQNLDQNEIADGQNVFDLGDALGSYLADVYQTVEAGFHLDECAEGHDADDLAFNDGAYGILLNSIVPGLLGELLEAQRDAFLFLINGKNENFNFLVGLNYIRGMLNACPGKIGNMDEAVNAAQIYECTEIGESADDTLDGLAFFDVLPSCCLLGCALFNDDCLAGSNQALLMTVNFDDLQADFLAHELIDLLNKALGELGCGNEGADAVYVDDEAALDDFFTGTGYDFAIVISFNELIPIFAGEEAALGELNIAFTIVDLDDLGLDLVADLELGFNILCRGQLALGDDAVGLVADIQAYFVISNEYNSTGYELTGPDGDHRLFKRSLEAFLVLVHSDVVLFAHWFVSSLNITIAHCTRKYLFLR